jgi:hypothetical protein
LFAGAQFAATALVHNVCEAPRPGWRATRPRVPYARTMSSMARTRDAGRIPWSLRTALFLACGTSGAALLAKVFGILSMRTVTIALALPCAVALFIVWIRAARRKQAALRRVLAIGFLGGLVGTFAYDVARIPFHLAGQRIFAPISAYGIWIADASASSGLTETIGWSYHVANGITFGMMYALVMEKRGWGWAVVWGIALESIALFSPFGRIFSMTGNVAAISIAYAGHIAWGVPLGIMVQHADAVQVYMARVSRPLKWAGLVVGIVALTWPWWSPAERRHDQFVTKGTFQADGDLLRPAWLRMQRGEPLWFRNPGTERIAIRALASDVQVAAGDSARVVFPGAGVFQVFVETERRSRSSFVIVEPVEANQ